MSKIFRAAYENSYWYELIDDKFRAACFAEFIAMVYFIILGVGGAMTTLHETNPNLVEIALSFGFSVMVIAQFCGPLSGAHINCAVSFALFIGGRISGIRCLYYTGCQLFGAFIGALFLLIIFGTNFNPNFASNQWDPDVYNAGKVFLAEMFGTAILIFNVYATIDHPIAGGGALGVFPISMSVLVAHLYLIPIDGCSINPTRSFGPYLIAAYCGKTGSFREQQYMCWFGPYMGASIASLIYEYGSLRPKRRSGGGDLSTNLHLSDVAGAAHIKDGDDDDDNNDIVEISFNDDEDDDEEEEEEEEEPPFVWTIANVVELLQIFNFLGIPSPFHSADSSTGNNSEAVGATTTTSEAKKKDIELTHVVASSSSSSSSSRPWESIPANTSENKSQNKESQSLFYRYVEYIYPADGEDENADLTITAKPIQSKVDVVPDLISFESKSTPSSVEEFTPSVSTPVTPSVTAAVALTLPTTSRPVEDPIVTIITESKETQTAEKEAKVTKDATTEYIEVEKEEEEEEEEEEELEQNEGIEEEDSVFVDCIPPQNNNNDDGQVTMSSPSTLYEESVSPADNTENKAIFTPTVVDITTTDAASKASILENVPATATTTTPMKLTSTKKSTETSPVIKQQEPTTPVPELIQYYEEKTSSIKQQQQQPIPSVSSSATTSGVSPNSSKKITPNKPNKPNKNKSMKSP